MCRKKHSGYHIACLAVFITVVVACSASAAAVGPVEIVSTSDFHSDISVDSGTAVGFGLATIRSASNAPVTNLAATLVPDGTTRGSVVEVYAVESVRWDLPAIAVADWETVLSELHGHEVKLEDFTLTADSGLVNILFKIIAHKDGRSDWSHIVFSYEYEGQKYSETISGSFSLCAPATIKCDS
jgi:hypothetical protein